MSDLASKIIASSINKLGNSQWQVDAQLHPGDPSLEICTIDHALRTVMLNLHQGQWQAWHSTARFVFMLAGTQGGKTSFLPWLLLREILSHGTGDYLAITSTFELFKLKFLPMMRQVFEHDLRIGRYWAGARLIELKDPHGNFLAERADDKMWARIILGSAQASSGLESATAKAALLDECGQDKFTLEAWEATQRRLSLAQGRAFGGTTIYNLGWVKQLVYDPWIQGDETYEIVQFNSAINPQFPREEMDRQREKMPLWKYKMFYEGEFTNPPGQIYEDYVDDYKEHNGHLVKPFQLHPDWHRVCAVDPGIINIAVGWYAHDPLEDIWYLYKERKFDKRLSMLEYAQTLVQESRQHKWKVKAWAVGAESETYFRQDFVKAGARGVYSPKVRQVEKGIDKVIELFKLHRLYIFDTCTYTRSDLLSYAREVDEMGNSMPKIKDKAKFHFADQLRYFGVYEARAKRSNILPQVQVSSWIGKRYGQ